MLKKGFISAFVAALLVTFTLCVVYAETITVVISIETVVKMRSHIVGTQMLSQKDYENLDLNQDNLMNIQDVVIARALVVGNMSISDLPGYSSNVGDSDIQSNISSSLNIPSSQVVNNSNVSTNYNNDSYEQKVNEILELVNKEREKNGLHKYKLNETLCKAAQKRAEELTSSFGHTRPDGTKFHTVFDEFNLNYKYAGENVAAGQKTPERVMEMWLASEGHRENILSPYFTEIGIGYVETDDKYGAYWTQEFYHPMQYNVDIK